MRIKRFNEVKEYHTINPEDIEDYAIEMTDAGFNMTVTKGFICDGKRTKHPVTDTSIPYYNIEFSIEEGQLESDPERWNGSYYLADRDFLKMFLHFVTRMELYGRSFWYISNNRYTCDIWLKDTETEIEFDWYSFSKKMEEKVDSIKRQWREFEVSDHWMSGGNHGVGFKCPINNESYEDYKKKMDETESDQDNKKDYDELREEWEEFLSKYKNDITYTISYELEKEYDYTKKMGFLKKDKYMKFKFYTLQIRARAKEGRD